MIKPYYQDDKAGITIYCGDCREILPEFDDLSFNFAWTDPPYNVGKTYASWDDALPDEGYLWFCDCWISHLKRLTPEIAVYVPTKYIVDYWNRLGKQYKQIVLSWTPEGAIRSGFINQFASILTNAKPKQRTKDVWNNLQTQGLGYFFRENDYGNPGYTSEDITRKVISSFTVPGDTLLDCFLGTGTTAVCCKKLNRKCVGIEIDEASCEIAVKRLAQEVMNFET
jgi:DNA modification methylase